MNSISIDMLLTQYIYMNIDFLMYCTVEEMPLEYKSYINKYFALLHLQFPHL